MTAHTAASPRATTAQVALAPLCVVAVGSAFTAQVMVDADSATLGALSVVPVLVASLLRSRPLTLIVAAFAMLLQVWGVAAHVINREVAGMQISVYLLTLAVVALQQSRSPLAVLDATAPVRASGDTGDEICPLPRRIAGILTRRERDVVQLAARGLTARQIGSLFFIGDRTVETHLANAYGKLGVRSKMELVRLVSTRSDEGTEFRTDTEAVQNASA